MNENGLLERYSRGLYRDANYKSASIIGRPDLLEQLPSLLVSVSEQPQMHTNRPFRILLTSSCDYGRLFP